MVKGDLERVNSEKRRDSPDSTHPNIGREKTTRLETETQFILILRAQR